MGEKLAKDIKHPEKTLQDSKTPNDKTIFLNPTNKKEIIEIINSRANKAGGVDGINIKIIKIIAGNIAESLSHIFNICIDQGVWPTSLKSCEIVPVYKGGNKHLCTNYRPISLISNFAKIFESVVHGRLTNFLEGSKILSHRQFGFRKGLGTSNAIAHLTEHIYSNINNGLCTVGAFLDLSKAFDTINHSLLLKKLENCGIRGKSLELITSYLTGREQKVKIQNTFSDSRVTKTGVPQGTILGPLFFIVYINDLLQESCIAYADDTVVLHTADNWSDAEKGMNEILGRVSNYFAANQLSLNKAKSVFMTFGSYSDSLPSHITVKIDNEYLSRVKSTKYLGIIFDENMRWEQQMLHIVNKTKYCTYIFYKLKKIMTANQLRMIYFALFHTIMTYGIIGWGGAYTNVSDVIQKLQNKILKYTNKEGILTIKQSYFIQSLIMNYENLSSRFLNSQSNTRNKTLPLMKYKKEIYKKSHTYIAIKIFNNIPNCLKSVDVSNLRNKKSFKNILKKNIAYIEEKIM